MNDSTASEPKRHLLTVNLEDYFQVGTLRSVIRQSHWYRFENRVAENTRKALDLLDEHGARATFFALGWIADELPEVIREVVDRGHEIASKGYFHRSIAEMSPGQFREEAIRSREAIERAARVGVRGFRIARGWFSPSDLWALDILAEEGFSYDSSLRPFMRSVAHDDRQRVAHIHRAGEKQIWEFPLSTWTIGGFSFPIAGGNYIRQFPNSLMKMAAAQWDRTTSSPFVLYFHVWELDPEQPRVKAAPLFQRIRQYRNLDKMAELVSDYLKTYSFVGMSDYLGLPKQTAGTSESPETDGLIDDSLHLPAVVNRSGDDAPILAEDEVPPEGKRAVTIVVPCFNEEITLHYLANTLRSVETRLSETYDLSFVFVDDCSTDKTWETLVSIFGDRTDCTLVRHPVNQGVAAAILTGIHEANSEIVCSIDCDCTYDPHALERMIPMLEDDVDLVTASPYHPDGKVLNVPGWRLALSKSLSAIYRRILTQKLATYTSCFRVYRRSALTEIRIREGGFLGVAETVALLDLMGHKIVEFPAVLEVRLLGESKMKVLRTILGHLRLLVRMIRERRRSGRANRANSEIPKTQIPEADAAQRAPQ